MSFLNSAGLFNAIPDSGVYLDDWADNKLANRDSYTSTPPEDGLDTDITSDFSDPSRAEWTDQNGSISATNQHLDIPDGSSTDQIISASSPMSEGTWDFEFTADGSTSNGAVYYFMHTDTPSDPVNNDGYGAQLLNDGRLRLWKFTNGPATILVNAGSVGWDDGATHTLKITYSSGDWELFFDDSSQGTASDTDYDIPHLAIYSSLNTSLTIDNMRVF